MSDIIYLWLTNNTHLLGGLLYLKERVLCCKVSLYLEQKTRSWSGIFVL